MNPDKKHRFFLVKKGGKDWQKIGRLVYQTQMNLYLAPLNQTLRVKSFSHEDDKEISDLESRLMHLGFVDGANIFVRKKSRFFQGPLLVEVRGRLVALTKSEASLVEVDS